ncbi:conserved protein of unknown function [Tenacibaculum sp. 190524A02b]|uniref:hypothetical protein n=1 Tax=Tenacibaculum vairaonense TaxID=3137860 RepID=UPI0032B13F28
MIAFIKRLLRKREFISKRQKKIFKTTIKPSVESKIVEMKKDNERLDEEIKELQLDILLLENNIKVN